MNQTNNLRRIGFSFLTFILLLTLPIAAFADSAPRVTTEADLVIKFDCSSTDTKQVWKIKNPTAAPYSSSWPNGGYWIARSSENGGAGWIKEHWLPNIAAGEEITVEFEITKWGEFSGKNIPARLDIANKDYTTIQYKLAVCEVEKKIDIQLDRTEGSKAYFNVTNTTDQAYEGQWYAFVNTNYANDGRIIIPNDGQTYQLVVSYWDLKNKPLTKLVLSAPDSGWLGVEKPYIAVWTP